MSEFDFYTYGKVYGERYKEEINKKAEIIMKNYGNEAYEDFLVGIAATQSAFANGFFVKEEPNYKLDEEDTISARRPHAIAKKEYYTESVKDELEYDQDEEFIETEEARKERLNAKVRHM